MCVCVCVCVCVHMNVSMYFYNDAHVFVLCVCTCIHVHRSDMCYPKIEWTGDPSTPTLSMSSLVMFSRLGLFEGDMKFTMSKMSPKPHRKSNAEMSNCCTRRIHLHFALNRSYDVHTIVCKMQARVSARYTYVSHGLF